MNDETCERLGQSAKRSAAVRGQAGRGATVAGRRRPGAAEQNVGIFCPTRFCGGSRADLLLERQSTALLPSCATHLLTFSSFENARPLQKKDYELPPSNYTTKRLIPTSRRQHKLLLRCCLARERFCFLLPSRASFALSVSVSLCAAILDILYLFFRSTTLVGIFFSPFFFFFWGPLFSSSFFFTFFSPFSSFSSRCGALESVGPGICLEV